MKTVIIKAGRKNSLKRFHPWVFSGSVKSAEQSLTPGDTVDVVASDGAWLARGSFSPHSQIRIRLWSFDAHEEISATFFRNRLERAIGMREPFYAGGEVTALRLVNAESDGLPGLIVDRYGEYLVCQFLSAGADRWKRQIAEALNTLLPVRGIYERSDTEARTREGLKSSVGVLLGEDPPGLVEIREHDLRFHVDLRSGHKTGFYLDQRDNRALMPFFTEGKEVLNCFAYTGGFGICAQKAGASAVTHIETSKSALDLARMNAALNGLPDNAVYLEDDVFTALRAFRDRGRTFDVIILDPPKFVSSSRQIIQGGRGYKDINLLALKLLRKGGCLFTFSCSAHVEPPLFYKIVADAATDARRDVRIIRYLFQSEDHPVSLYFPEGLYLKGLICRVW